MKPLVSLIVILFLTSCLDYATSVARKTNDRLGGTDNVAQVTVDNLFKAEEAARWLYAAKGGDAEAQYNLGKAFCCGKRPFYNTYDALRWFCRAAKQGQRDAMLEIGKIYEHAHNTEGSVIPRDDVLAFVYYQKSYEHGNEVAEDEKRRKYRKLNRTQKALAKETLEKWPKIQCEIN